VQEKLLHFIWKHRKFPFGGLRTTKGMPLHISFPGTENELGGPDFQYASILLDGLEWAGPVEIHIRSLDWYAHQHQLDAAYDNVILHVVWEANGEVYRKDGSCIPCLELKEVVSRTLLDQYAQLFLHKRDRKLLCEEAIRRVPRPVVSDWLQLLFTERLRQKSNYIQILLNETRNDWEHVFFRVLLKCFGLNHNGPAFESLGNALPFSVLRRYRTHPVRLEALLFGMIGLLDNNPNSDHYYLALQKEYRYLITLHQLRGDAVLKPHFFKLRPGNFPTIRLSQFCSLYTGQVSLFGKVIQANTKAGLRDVLRSRAGPYWDNHYTFGTLTPSKPKWSSTRFLDLLIINAVLPVKYSYAQHRGENEWPLLTKISGELKAEQNHITRIFSKVGVSVTQAIESQALVQLYNDYCSKNKCLQCAVGCYLLSGK
jgi:hypothetical protein